MQKLLKSCVANTNKCSAARKIKEPYNLKQIWRQIWALRAVIIVFLAYILPLDFVETVEGHSRKVMQYVNTVSVALREKLSSGFRLRGLNFGLRK